LKHKIGIRRYTTGNLTWKQDKKIGRFISSLKNKSSLLEEDFKISELFKLLHKYDLLERFLAVVVKRSFLTWLIDIITGHWFTVSIEVATNDQIQEMAEDFFLSNKNLLTTFQKYGGVLGLIANMGTTMIEQKQKPSSSNPIKEKT